MRILLLGAGKIGRMIAGFLARTGDYEVCVADADEAALARIAEQVSVETTKLDAASRSDLKTALTDRDCVLSALSYRFNPLVAEVCLETGSSYFDLTEDVDTTRAVRAVSEQAAAGQIFMPQCGLAPGFISIIANHLADQFDEIDTVHMRVGALPQFPSNALKYNLTWSTDGLINEYCNLCEAIHEGEKIDVLALQGLEHFSLDGVRYEAFNTSGGLGTLCESLAGKTRMLNYKTIRYPGHRELVSFLVKDLRLSEQRETLKQVLEHAIPVTFQDVVVTFCTVSGKRNDQFVQISDARKIYSESLHGEWWSAIQITTAAGLCAALDLHRDGRFPESGFVRQEQIDFDEFLANRFGKHYHSPLARQLPLGDLE